MVIWLPHLSTNNVHSLLCVIYCLGRTNDMGYVVHQGLEIYALLIYSTTGQYCESWTKTYIPIPVLPTCNNFHTFLSGLHGWVWLNYEYSSLLGRYLLSYVYKRSNNGMEIQTNKM